MASKEKSEELRQQGNECVKAGSYNEAVLHYSHALSIDPNNHLLYSNRSFAFLKLQQHYLALQDALQTIKLQPTWTKGYYRKGEVEYSVGHYEAAFMTFTKALLLDSTNDEVRKALKKANSELIKERKWRKQQPWLVCGCGSLLGLAIVLADHHLASKPSIQNMILQIVLVLVFGCLGYIVLLVYKYIKTNEVQSRLEAPVDLMKEMGMPASNTEPEPDIPSKENGSSRPVHRKGGLGAARQKFKKGKS